MVLEKRQLSVDNLLIDLADGVKLAALIEILSGT